ncbi:MULTISPECIES: GGDEF domain-containing protein [unclassified Oleiphilus]|nr:MULTISPECIES: GGDEF domain-containing protein [unclassified Oleiphilus]KZY41327.1 hypothetical protein A3732_18370 [Oleiphilus sp. HI0050]KZY76929.1 hypothetical protein A3740_11550 [Oleiphilus sp. HI0068]KZY77852.1 hypothetical protein A3741_01215 [Oleiphilus sp. HI0069]KZY87785.1 hypothetical protein A3743_13380 [Oleiphilus sp. HI0072]KZZ23870.1 hypothetical protein A3752_05405 [Oleiphilus sp. HI0081]
MSKYSDAPSNNRQNVELSESVKWLRLAVAKINELSIPATPEVYSVWYEYYADRKLDLKKAIDKRISKGGDFSASTCEHLFNEYFVEIPEQKLSEMRQAIRALITLLQSELSELNSGMESYSAALYSCADDLTHDPEVNSLQSIIQVLLAETKKCRSRNHQALSKVYHLSSEINSLQESLEKMGEEVYQDSLTGVGNRRGFDEQLSTAIKKSQLDNSPLALILLDIDFFKRVNDAHGHLVGDRVLRFVAETIKRSVKGGDFVARYGGEEFAIILPNTEAAGGSSVAHQVQANVAKTKLTKKKGGTPIESVTISGGLSILRECDTAESFLNRVDGLLYDAKSAGRNMIRSDCQQAIKIKIESQ